VVLFPLFTAFFQNETTGGVVEEAAKAAQEIPQQTEDRLGGIGNLFGNIAAYLSSAEFIVNILATVIIVVLALIFYRVAVYLIPRILRWSRPEDEEALDAASLYRIKRQDTAVTLVRTTLRYVIFIIVALFVLSIFLRNVLPGIAGASLLAAIVGFGAQSFLRDVIAGFSIIFEGQYSVGDFIEVQPQGVSGIVEELGLRMTKIRSLSGEVSYVPNGAMQGVTNYVSGQQRFNVEVQLSDAEAVPRVLGSLDETKELYLTPPRLAEREERGGRVRLRILAGVLPSMAWLVEENLTERIKAAAGEESLAADPLVYKVDQADLSRIRELLPQEAERNLPREAKRKLGFAYMSYATAYDRFRRRSTAATYIVRARARRTSMTRQG
jgi:small conductance mechanosensitive channel